MCQNNSGNFFLKSSYKEPLDGTSLTMCYGKCGGWQRLHDVNKRSQSVLYAPAPLHCRRFRGSLECPLCSIRNGRSQPSWIASRIAPGLPTSFAALRGLSAEEIIHSNCTTTFSFFVLLTHSVVIFSLVTHSAIVFLQNLFRRLPFVVNFCIHLHTSYYFCSCSICSYSFWSYSPLLVINLVFHEDLLSYLLTYTSFLKSLLEQYSYKKSIKRVSQREVEKCVSKKECRKRQK